MLNGIQTETSYTSRFHKPVSPVIEVLDDFRMLKVQVSVHEVVVVAVFVIDQFLVCPTFIVSLDQVNTRFTAFGIVVCTGEVVPVPFKVIIGFLTSIKSEVGPSVDSKGLT